MIIRLYSLIVNSAYLRNTHFTFLVKLRIIFKAFFINFVYTFSKKKSNISLFGYKVRSFNYGTIRILFEELFLKNEYYFITKKKEPVIFDCGANIGFATLYFKWLYPNSKVFSFEPDPETFQLLKFNIESNNLSNVTLINAAVSTENGKLSFFVDKSKPGIMGMSVVEGRISDQTEIEVDAISIQSILKKHNLKTIDFLKMDIEGAENDVMRGLSENGTLSKINQMAIEYHHNISGSKSSLGDFLKHIENAKHYFQVDTRYSAVGIVGQMQNLLITCRLIEKN